MATTKKSTAKKTAAKKVAKTAPKKCATRTCKKKEQKGEKHKFIIFGLAVVLIILCGSLGAMTWARYATTVSGTASTQVAKWAVQIKQGSTVITGSDAQIPLTVDCNGNTQVVAGKIAPGCSASGDVTIDFTGTEVSTEVSVAFTLPNTLAASNAEVTATIDGGNTQNAMSCTTSGNVTTCSGFLSLAEVQSTPIVTVTPTINWDDHDSYVAATDSEIDTQDGITAGTISLGVTISAKQSFGHTF